MARENIGRNLPHEELVVLLRRRVDGLTIRQTATACNLSKTTVQSYAPNWLIAVIREMMREKNAEPT